MGDVEEGDPDFALDLLQLDLHLLAQLQVERSERLVEQQHRGAVDERTGERHALHLPPRELARLGVLPAGELDELERLRHAAADLVAGHLAALQPEGDVPLHVEVLEQGVALEHRVDVPRVGRDVIHRLALQVHAPLGRLLESGDHAQRGRLPAPGRPEQREELAAPDRQGEVVDRDGGAEALRHALEADRLLRRCRRRRLAARAVVPVVVWFAVMRPLFQSTHSPPHAAPAGAAARRPRQRSGTRSPASGSRSH